MHGKAKQVFHNLFSTNQGNSSDMTFMAGATKINLKNLKTWRHQLYSNRRFEPLTNSGRSLTWTCKLKALKSSSQISAKNWLKIFLIHMIPLSYALQCCYQCSNFTSLRWWRWSSLSLPCVLIFMQCVWFAEF